ncbi:hypothetical protein P3S68_006351 [Capsicum galapagoense]
MDHNECNNQLRATLHDVLGLEDSNSLHGNENSYGGYVEGPDRYLDIDDEDLQNLADGEMNRSHQSIEDEDVNVSDDEEDHYVEDDVEEEEGSMHDDSYTEEQYTTGSIEGLRPSKSMRLLEVKAGGPERMRCTPKDCRNYILQQQRLRTLSSDAAALHRFFVDM